MSLEVKDNMSYYSVNYWLIYITVKLLLLDCFREHEGDSSETGDEKSLSKEKEKPMTEAERRQSLFPGKKVEKWERPLENKTVQQQVDKICEWKCVYSRPNAKIRWYKDKKEIFSVCFNYFFI